MSSFDPMAAAIDWLDAYRAASIEIVDLYADGATLECCCGGMKVIAGRGALIAYWRQRFVHNPAGELEDLQPEGTEIGVSYRVADGIVQVTLSFDANGKIERSRCGPTARGCVAAQGFLTNCCATADQTCTTLSLATSCS